MEAALSDNPKMIFRQQAAGEMRAFSRVPDIGSKDIRSFTSFPSEDGDYGLLFLLNEPAQRRLAATTNVGQGRFLCAMLNGRVVDAVKIDKPVEDGKLVIWKGATIADIAALDESYPRIGQEGNKNKKKD